MRNTLPKFSFDAQLEIMKSFSNQQEGEPTFYFILEKSASDKINELSFSKKIDVLKIFFNTKYGSKKFVSNVLQAIEEELEFYENQILELEKHPEGK